MTLYGCARANPIRFTDPLGNLVDVTVGDSRITVRMWVVYWGAKAFESHWSGVSNWMWASCDFLQAWNGRASEVCHENTCKEVVFRIAVSAWHDPDGDCDNLGPMLLSDPRVVACDGKARSQTGMQNSMWIRPPGNPTDCGGANAGYRNPGARSFVRCLVPRIPAHEFGHLMQLSGHSDPNCVMHHPTGISSCGCCSSKKKILKQQIDDVTSCCQ